TPAQAKQYTSVAGLDRDTITIQSSSHALPFQTAPDFENPHDSDADNVYAVQVRVEDGAGGSDTRTINVTVQNVSELSGIILADDVVAGHVPGLTGYLLHGIAGGDYAGFAVAPAGDVDGDGIADFLIGAPGADYATGETYLVLGGTANLAALDGDGDHVIALGDLEFGNGYLLKGLRPDDYWGWAVSAAGDVN